MESMAISLRNFENFEMFCPLGAMKLGVQQKKLLHLIQPSQDPTYIFFLDSGVTGKCRNGHFWLKFGRVTSIYGALMLLIFCGGGLGLELSFLEFQIEENFWEAKFQVFI